jgi:hypothetical protein
MQSPDSTGEQSFRTRVFGYASSVRVDRAPAVSAATRSGPRLSGLSLLFFAVAVAFIAIGFAALSLIEAGWFANAPDV